MSSLFGADSTSFGNIFTYLGFPLSRELNSDVDAVVMGIPYDLATTGRSGTRFGPNGIRQASSHLRWEEQRWPWRFNLRERLKVIDYGDIVYEEGNSDDMMEAVIAEAGRIFSAGKKLLTFGGDHFLSLPVMRATYESHGELALVHFDAHTDTEETDARYNHGSMFYLAAKEGLYNPCNSIQVGIRTEYDEENHDLQVLDARWCNNHSPKDIIQQIKERVGDRPVYLSFDIDCLDPAFAPGTGTPVIGGLTTSMAQQILQGLTGLNIVAADVMEVAPAYDHGDVTSLAGASLALDILHLWASPHSP